MPKRASCLFSSLFLLSACSYSPIREDIKEFIDPLSASKAELALIKGSVSYSFSLFKDGEKTGEGHKEISWKKEGEDRFYSYIERGNGSALENGFFESYSFLLSLSGGRYRQKEEKNGVEKEKESDVNSFDNAITSFFYTDSESGYKTGGFYYGDFLKMNVRYQDAMSVDDEKKTLTLSFDSLEPEEGAKGAIYLVVDDLGMAKEYRFTMEKDGTRMVTSFETTLVRKKDL